MSFPVQTLLIHLACNLFTFLLSYVVLYTDWLSKDRIQTKAYSEGVLWRRLPLILLNLTILSLLVLVGLRAMSDYFVLNEYPSAITLTWQVLVILFFDDLYFYFYHRLLHENKFLLAKIHSIHHKASTPFPMEYIYVHPLEWLMGSLGPFIGILVLGNVNIYSFWTYIIIRNLHEADIHSGIRSVFFKYVPFVAPAEHHDLHHSKPFGNYASTFSYLDRLFGTAMKAKN